MTRINPDKTLRRICGYWRDQPDTELAHAIIDFVACNYLTENQISDIRAYLKTWIDNPVWDSNRYFFQEDRAALTGLRASVRALSTHSQIKNWIVRANYIGIYPL